MLTTLMFRTNLLYNDALKTIAINNNKVIISVNRRTSTSKLYDKVSQIVTEIHSESSGTRSLLRAIVSESLVNQFGESLRDIEVSIDSATKPEFGDYQVRDYIKSLIESII